VARLGAVSDRFIFLINTSFFQAVGLHNLNLDCLQLYLLFLLYIVTLEVGFVEYPEFCLLSNYTQFLFFFILSNLEFVLNILGD
jgi:hypothetical protein